MLTAAALLKRLLALLPPPRLHLTRYHGVFAPHAKLRRGVARRELAAPEPEPDAAAKPPASGPSASRPVKRPRLDWAEVQRRTFGEDVTRCPCGGRRRVVAIVTGRNTIDEVLGRMKLLSPRPKLPPATAPPQLALAL